jgi:hypothetical protein
MDAVSHLLDYCSTPPEASIRYYASDMQLKIQSDASYLSEPKSKSIIGGYFYLGKTQAHPRNPYPMARLCAIQQYSNMWSLLWLKPNLMHFLSMQKKALSHAQHFLKGVTNRTAQNSKLTTPQQITSSITNSNKSTPRQWM